MHVLDSYFCMCKIVTYVEQCIRRTVPIRQPRMSNSAYVGHLHVSNSAFDRELHMSNNAYVRHFTFAYVRHLHMSNSVYVRLPQADYRPGVTAPGEVWPRNHVKQASSTVCSPISCLGKH